MVRLSGGRQKSKISQQVSRTQWRWTLYVANNKIANSGEGYHNKADAISAINLVKGTNSAAPVRE